MANSTTADDAENTGHALGAALTAHVPGATYDVPRAQLQPYLSMLPLMFASDDDDDGTDATPTLPPELEKLMHRILHAKVVGVSLDGELELNLRFV